MAFAVGRFLHEQYETLRREALAENGRERGHGLALFLARGMTAWVAAVGALTPVVSKPQQCIADDGSHSPRATLPVSYRAELTTVLAGMVLACSGW
ncbi:MAG TPA: hypothetical protein VGI36_01435 [Candidatus Binataceae bacterium]